MAGNSCTDAPDSNGRPIDLLFPDVPISLTLKRTLSRVAQTIGRIVGIIALGYKMGYCDAKPSYERFVGGKYYVPKKVSKP